VIPEPAVGLAEIREENRLTRGARNSLAKDPERFVVASLLQQQGAKEMQGNRVAVILGEDEPVQPLRLFELVLTVVANRRVEFALQGGTLHDGYARGSCEAEGPGAAYTTAASRQPGGLGAVKASCRRA
jgi:hypothetical protein